MMKKHSTFIYGEFATIKSQAESSFRTGYEHEMQLNFADYGSNCITLVLKRIEFDAFRNESGLNSFALIPQKWILASC